MSSRYRINSCWRISWSLSKKLSDTLQLSKDIPDLSSESFKIVSMTPLWFLQLLLNSSKSLEMSKWRDKQQQRVCLCIILNIVTPTFSDYHVKTTFFRDWGIMEFLNLEIWGFENFRTPRYQNIKHLVPESSSLGAVIIIDSRTSQFENFKFADIGPTRLLTPKLQIWGLWNWRTWRSQDVRSSRPARLALIHLPFRCGKILESKVPETSKSQVPTSANPRTTQQEDSTLRTPQKFKPNSRVQLDLE